MAIDEAQARRPDFIDGIPVTFRDGTVLHLPRPRQRYCRRRDEEGKPCAFLVRHFEADGPLPPEYRDGGPINEAFDRFTAARTDADALPALMDLAALMIGRNYTLTEEQINDLLVYEVGNTADTERFAAISLIAQGIDPRPAEAVAAAGAEG